MSTTPPAGLDRWITEGPRMPRATYEVVCTGCGATWESEGRPELGTVELDHEDCPTPDCPGGALELYR